MTQFTQQTKIPAWVKSLCLRLEIQTSPIKVQSKGVWHQEDWRYWTEMCNNAKHFCWKNSKSMIAGSPPNLVVPDTLIQRFGDATGLTFASWMAFAIPVMLVTTSSLAQHFMCNQSLWRWTWSWLGCGCNNCKGGTWRGRRGRVKKRRRGRWRWSRTSTPASDLWIFTRLRWFGQTRKCLHLLSCCK